MNCYLGDLGVPLESQTTNLPLADTFPTKKKVASGFPLLGSTKNPYVRVSSWVRDGFTIVIEIVGLFHLITGRNQSTYVEPIGSMYGIFAYIYHKNQPFM